MIKGAGKLIPLSTIRLLGKMYYFFQLFLTVLTYFVHEFTPQRNLHLNIFTKIQVTPNPVGSDSPPEPDLGKDDRKQNTLAPSIARIFRGTISSGGSPFLIWFNQHVLLLAII
jgi:hypothetical protein